MKLIKYLPVIVLLLAISSCKDKTTNPPDDNNNKPPGYQEKVEWPSLDDNPWPIHHGDTQFTGRSRYLGPMNGQIVWKIEIPATNINDDSFLSPVIGNDSTIYFISFRDTASPYAFLHSIDFSGEENWTFPLPYEGEPTGKTTAPPIITSKGILYIADWSRNLYSISKNGEMIWKKDLTESILGRMNVNKEGTLYFIDTYGELYSVNENGSINWTIKLSENGSNRSTIAISPNDQTLIVAANDLYAVSKEGNLKWTFDTSTLFTSNHTPIIDSEGNIYITNFLSDTSKIGFLSIKPDGTLRFKKNYTTYNDPTIDKEGNIYLPTTEGLVSLDYFGNFRWSKPFQLGSNASALISDIEGNIFFITEDKLLTKIDKNGNTIWQIEVDGQSFESPALGKEGNLFFGTVYGSSRYYYNIK